MAVALFSFFANSDMCFFQDSFESIMTPRYLTWLDKNIFVPLILIVKRVFTFLLLLWKSTSSVFFAFNERRLAHSQSYILRQLTKCGGSIKPHTINRNPYPICIRTALDDDRHHRSTAANWFYTLIVIAREGLVTRDPAGITIGKPGCTRWSFIIQNGVGGKYADWYIAILWRSVFSFFSSSYRKGWIHRVLSPCV